MDKWEYLTIEIEQKVKGGTITKAVHDTRAYTKQLNEYGHQGWELVSIFHTTSQALSGSRGTECLYAAFKRKI